MTHPDYRPLPILVRELRPLMLRVFRPDSCIAACRISKTVLDHFGLRFEPVPTSLFVANKKLWKRMRVEAVTLPLREGEYSVGAGYGYAPSHNPQIFFNGHLILVREMVNGADLILDPSLDQFSRPQHKMVLGPMFDRLPREWRQRKPEEGLALHKFGCALLYSVIERPERDFRDSPDWRNPSSTSALRDEIAETLIDLIEKELR